MVFFPTVSFSEPLPGIEGRCLLSARPAEVRRCAEQAQPAGGRGARVEMRLERAAVIAESLGRRAA